MKNNDLLTFAAISEAYRNSSRLVEEIEAGIITRSKEFYEGHYRIKKHIENVVEAMNYKSKMIVKNDLIYGPESKWYIDKMSANSYYTLRKKAYSEFLRCLEL